MSWKTTAIGVLSIVCGALLYFMDGDKGAAAGLISAGLAGVFAKDHDK